MSGRFITLEGGEGVGKSTQIKALSAALEARGLQTLVTREPGGSPGAEAVRRLLLEGAVDRWSPEAEALLFAAARSDHVSRTIKPAIDRGCWVLCDRYLDSSLAYQGLVGEVGVERIRALHAIGSHDFLPDRTLLLRLDESEALARTRHRDGDDPDRFGARADDYHRRVNAAFDRLAEEAPDRFRRIDAQGSAEQVTARLIEALQDLF